MSSEDVAISVQYISKFFERYEKPSHRLLQMLYHEHKLLLPALLVLAGYLI